MARQMPRVPESSGSASQRFYGSVGSDGYELEDTWSQKVRTG